MLLLFLHRQHRASYHSLPNKSAWHVKQGVVRPTGLSAGLSVYK